MEEEDLLSGKSSFCLYFQPTKTRDSRQVPLPPELQKELEVLRIASGGKYLFSIGRGEKPVCIQSLNNSLKLAMTAIGIPPEEQKRRNICFHGWRHFFNTTMRTNNISDGKLQKLTGHKSQKMTDHYTHFKIDYFQDVKKVQAKILQMPLKVGVNPTLGRYKKPIILLSEKRNNSLPEPIPKISNFGIGRHFFLYLLNF